MMDRMVPRVPGYQPQAGGERPPPPTTGSGGRPPAGARDADDARRIARQPRLDAGEPGGWTFGTPEVARDFDRHVREQLPWYDLATGLVTHVGRHVIPERGVVVDLGASTGNVGRALAPVLDQREATIVPIDSSEAMREVYAGPGRLIVQDIREYPIPPCDLVVCFLVLMFLPIEDRRQLLIQAWNALRSGGAILVFDKLEPAGGIPGLIASRLTLAAKYEAGATPEEIIRKELSLAGVQRPLREAELSAQPFVPLFRFGEFGGWVAVKD